MTVDQSPFNSPHQTATVSIVNLPFSPTLNFWIYLIISNVVWTASNPTSGCNCASKPEKLWKTEKLRVPYGKCIAHVQTDHSPNQNWGPSLYKYEHFHWKRFYRDIYEKNYLKFFKKRHFLEIFKINLSCQ